MCRLATLCWLTATVVAGIAGCGSNTTETITRHVSVRPAPTTTSVTSSAASTNGTSAPVSGPVLFQGVVGAGQQRPATLELTGDGTLFVSGVQWSSWGGAIAAGTGNAQYHGCTPNCAQATPHQALVSIRLSGIRSCSGRSYYAGLSLTLSSGHLLDPEFAQRSWSPC